MARTERALMFLDPVATEVPWTAVTAIAQTQRIDCWILFPLMAVTRMMPGKNETTMLLASQLDRVFGGREYWNKGYVEYTQPTLYGIEAGQKRLQGSEHIALLYKDRLNSVFSRVASTSRTLKNSSNNP